MGFLENFDAFNPFTPNSHTQARKRREEVEELNLNALRRQDAAAVQQQENLLRRQGMANFATSPSLEAAYPEMIAQSQQRNALDQADPAAAMGRLESKLYPKGFTGTLGENQVAYIGGEQVATGPAKAPAAFKPVNMQIPGTNRIVVARTPEEFNAYVDEGFVEQGSGVPGAKEEPRPYRVMTKEEAQAAGLPEGGSYKTNDLDFQAIVLPKQERATQGENTSAYHARRLATSLGTLGEILKKTPEAATSIVGGNNFASKWARSEDQNRVQAALPEIGDALLTLGTGAAYTEAQFENQWQSNLPAVGDSDQVLADKFGRIQALYDQAKSNAGPLAKDLPDLSSIAAIFQARASGKKPSAGREGWSIRKNG